VYPTGQRPPKCFVPRKQTTKGFKMRDNMKTTTDIFNIYDPRSNLNTKIAYYEIKITSKSFAQKFELK
jgi:hypothetical protein